MSELLNDRRQTIRWRLLTTVSAGALLASACGTTQAADADRAAIWIELGAQLEQTTGLGEPYRPPFSSEIVQDGLISPLGPQRALSQSFGGGAKVSFQPENSDWVFSASIRYGRANGGSTIQQQTPGGRRQVHLGTYSKYITPTRVKFSGTQTRNEEAHTILDFQSGKDIGLGLFKGGGTSTVGFGVRFAQFTSKQTLTLNADPDLYIPSNDKYSPFRHTYAVASHIERSFRGLGPSISWNASALVIGDAEQGGIALDWGVNAAVLVGRQKVTGHHETVGTYYKSNPLQKYHFTSHIHRSGNPNRSRTVIVPNLGGFAGFSFRFPNAKVSLGYRGDFFFSAMDGGIDVARKENRGFYGPFASVSVGIGG